MATVQIEPSRSGDERVTSVEVECIYAHGAWLSDRRCPGCGAIT